jgi:Predicted ferric reductase
MKPPDLASHAWWLASRASGLVALVLVTISVGIGLVMAGRLARRPGLPRILAALHEQTALTGLIAIGVHGITLLGDPWLNPGVKGIAVPFTMGYRPLFTGLGIIAGYLAALLGLSFYARRRIGPALWRKAHRATVVVYALGVAHTLGAGTDASAPWMRAFLAMTAPPIAVLFVVRLVNGRRARTRRAPAPSGSRSTAAATRGPGMRINPRPAMGEDPA